MQRRLTKILSQIPQCNTLADVGCDHGYVGIEALKTGRAKHVTFVDISAPSLKKARENCPESLKRQVDYLCQDGLKDLDVDCAVIAGMGGLETISILEQATTLPKYLVLQPMRNQRDVRQYLQTNYKIVTDEKFQDGKFYDLIFAERRDNPEKLTELQLEFGKTNLERASSDFLSYLRWELKKLKDIPIFGKDEALQAKALAMEKLIAELLAKN